MAETHFDLRCAQRNLSPETVAVILTHGTYVRDGRRTRVIVLNKDLRYLLADGLPHEDAKKVRGTMVILAEEGQPITAYHPSKGKLKRTKRITKTFGEGN